MAFHTIVVSLIVWAILILLILRGWANLMNKRRNERRFH